VILITVCHSETRPAGLVVFAAVAFNQRGFRTFQPMPLRSPLTTPSFEPMASFRVTLIDEPAEDHSFIGMNRSLFEIIFLFFMVVVINHHIKITPNLRKFGSCTIGNRSPQGKPPADSCYPTSYLKSRVFWEVVWVNNYKYHAKIQLRSIGKEK
jgi:hypothetical protein